MPKQYVHSPWGLQEVDTDTLAEAVQEEVVQEEVLPEPPVVDQNAATPGPQ